MADDGGSHEVQPAPEPGLMAQTAFSVSERQDSQEGLGSLLEGLGLRLELVDSPKAEGGGGPMPHFPRTPHPPGTRSRAES